jgi:hypothetical protein
MAGGGPQEVRKHEKVASGAHTIGLPAPAAAATAWPHGPCRIAACLHGRSLCLIRKSLQRWMMGYRSTLAFL